MDCPSCGRGNDPDRVECSQCEALLVDVFDGPYEKTEAIRAIGEDFEEHTTDSGDGFTRTPAGPQHTGDLPRLFRFGNRYQVLEKLGEGGMGRVYKALDLELDRAVALKTIRAEKGKGPEILKRFKQELVLARKITHKNVVRIYDLGEAEGVKFFTMELIEGQSLRDILRARKKLPPKEAVSLLKQMLSGLAEAHSQGVIHRDLKPHNIMIDGEGLVRIMDFGIARTADTATLTKSDEMMGTPDYISPEQVKGETATAQSDLYSTGVILYELLTGQVPFKGDTPIAKVVARLQTTPTSPRTLNPEIPSFLQRIVLKLMEVDSDLRYRSAAEVLQDLEREQVDSSRLLRTRKAILRRRGWIAACLAASLGVGAWLLLRNPSGEASADVQVTTLAILPFHNMTGNPELDWMENGIPEMLITDLSQLQVLRPVLPERMDRILRNLGKSGQSRFDDQTLELVSQNAGSQHSLHGSFVESQGRLRMDLILRQSGTGVGMPVKVEGASAQVFELVDELSRKVASELDLDSFHDTDRPFVELSTRSLSALRAYYQARSELQKGANQAAIPLLQAAVTQDPRFAMAHARLAETYFHLGDERNALASMATATALADGPMGTAERYQIHAIAARIEDDPETAVASYRELAKLFPDDPDILNSLASSLETQGNASESVKVYEEVLKLSPGHGSALLGLGRMMVVSGEPKEAIPLLREAQGSGYFKSDPEALGMIHSIIGVAYRDMARFEAAIEEFEQSLSYRRQTEDMRGVATSLNNLASVLRLAGRNEEARRHLDEALNIARQTKNETMESLALLNLGNLYADSGQLDLALEHFRRSLDIEWKRKEHTELAIRLDTIADVLARQALYSDALVYLELAKGYLERSDDVLEKARNLRALGRIAKTQGNYALAQKSFLEALQLFLEIGASRDAVEGYLLLASTYADQGRFDESLRAVDSGEQLVSEEAAGMKARAALTRAEIYIDLGDPARASADLDRVAESLEEGAQLDSLYLRLLRVRARGSGPDSAHRLLDQLIRDSAQAHWPELRWKALTELGRAQLRDEKVALAISTLNQAREETAATGSSPLQAVAALALAEAYHRRGNSSEASRLALEVLAAAESFEGRVLMARSYRLLSEAAMAQGMVADAEAYDREARAMAAAVLAQIPATLTAAFLEQHPWARPPSMPEEPETKKKGSP